MKKLSYPLLFICMTLLTAIFLSNDAQISFVSVLPISMLPGLLLACIVKMFFTDERIFAEFFLGKLLSKFSLSKGNGAIDFLDNNWTTDPSHPLNWTTNTTHPLYLLQEEHEKQIMEETMEHMS